MSMSAELMELVYTAKPRTENWWPGQSWLPVLLAIIAINVFWCTGCAEAGSAGKNAPTIFEVKHPARQLYSSGEPSSVTVQFSGIVTAADPLFGYLIVQDKTDGIRVNTTLAAEALLLGHKVDVRGSLAGSGQSSAVTDASIHDLGLGRTPDSVELSAGTRANTSLDNRLITLRGVVSTSRIDALGRLTLLVCPISAKGVRGAPVRALIIDDTSGPHEHYVDSESVVTGVLSATTNVYGDFSGFSIIVPTLSGVRVVLAAPDPKVLPLSKVADLLAEKTKSSLHLLRVKGQLRSASRTGLELVDDTGAIPVASSQGVDLSGVKAIDTTAFLSEIDGTPMLENLHPIMLAVRNETGYTPQVRAELRTAAAIRSLTPQEASLGLPVDLEGVITFWDPKLSQAFFEDSSAGIYVSLHGAANGYLASRGTSATGMRVRLRGVTGPGDFAPIVAKPHFDFLGKGICRRYGSFLKKKSFWGGLTVNGWNWKELLRAPLCRTGVRWLRSRGDSIGFRYVWSQALSCRKSGLTSEFGCKALAARFSMPGVNFRAFSFLYQDWIRSSVKIQQHPRRHR